MSPSMDEVTGTTAVSGELVWLFPERETVNVAVHPATGLPAALSLRTGARTAIQALATEMTVVAGGTERRSPFGGTTLDGVERYTAAHLEGTPGSDRTETGSPRGVVTVSTGPLRSRWTYSVTDRAPRVELSVEFTTIDGGDVVVRDFHISMVALTPLTTATSPAVHAPGNRLRRGLPLADLCQPVQVNTAGGTPGSSGLVALEDRREGLTFLFWPLSRCAIGREFVSRHDRGLSFELETGLAGIVSSARSLTYGSLHLDLRAEGWTALRAQIVDWYPPLGINLPDDVPDWGAAASIYEVQLGMSHFGRPADYCPYPSIDDLRLDLDRIASLGFNTIQLMPRQPFPSYNVVDYQDVERSYAPADDLSELVRDLHRRGMRIILDVIMHGVLDQRSITQAADAVRSGPHAKAVQPTSRYRESANTQVPDAHKLPWSKHIIDFETAWRDGSPAIHPLVVSHPDWFVHDSQGSIAGIYTNAFDLANLEFQSYFEDALTTLIERFGIDGIRFDAPTYNEFPNWSERTRHVASSSELASIDLFARLRRSLRPSHPELLFYTEPSGVLLRQHMDVNYNYDEHSQIEDLIGYQGVALGSLQPSDLGIRNARELADWMQDRDACLPRHAVTAHHIDSHDTYWWPRPGCKWRREQVGIDRVKPLASIFALSGGPYMTFVGGELGIEDHLIRIHATRHRDEFAWGVADYDAVSVNSPEVYAVVRHGEHASVVLVSMAAEDRTVDVTLYPWRPATAAINVFDGSELCLVRDDPLRITLRRYSTTVIELERSHA